VTAAADGEPFLRCNREELHPHDEYTLAQHKVSSQLGIPICVLLDQYLRWSGDYVQKYRMR